MNDRELLEYIAAQVGQLTTNVICQDICPLGMLYGSKGQRTLYGIKKQVWSSRCKLQNSV